MEISLENLYVDIGAYRINSKVTTIAYSNNTLACILPKSTAGALFLWHALLKEAIHLHSMLLTTMKPVVKLYSLG